MLQNSVLKGRKLEMTLQPTFQQILEYAECQAWLEKRTINITKRFLHIIDIFQDAKFEQQLRLEIEKVKPALIPSG